MKKIIKITESQLKQVIENTLLNEGMRVKYHNIIIKFDLYGPPYTFQFENEIRETLENKFGDNIKNIEINFGYVED